MEHFLNIQKKLREENSREWFKDKSPEMRAHYLLVEALYSHFRRHAGKKVEPLSDRQKNILSLLAQFIQGLEFCTAAISSGLYAQAAALLKQELETLWACSALLDGERHPTNKKTPHPHGRLKNYNRFYGETNDLSHSAKKDLMASLIWVDDGTKETFSNRPNIDPETSAYLLAQHCVFIKEAWLLFIFLTDEFWGKTDITAEKKLVREAYAHLENSRYVS